MQNWVIRTRISSLCGSQPSSIVLCIQKSDFMTRITCSVLVPTSSMVFACKTENFGPEIRVYMGPRPQLSFCACKTGVITTRITSLYGSQTSPVVVCMQNGDFRTRLTSLYGSQTSSVVLSTHNSVFCTRIYIKSICVPVITCGFYMQNCSFVDS